MRYAIYGINSMRSVKLVYGPLRESCLHCHPTSRSFSSHARSAQDRANTHDPRLEDFGKLIEDEYAFIREHYETPKHPIVLAHGLLGFDELRLAGPLLPGVQYWRGIKEAFSMKGVEVITATVPPCGSIEERAEELARNISIGTRGRNVNIIAHSMVG
ncbi:hypothetical protein VTN00DRAFT_3661 [Thermoascus crustaceus]|uniref:uncharacterized protein n=1 Tax=Thermoascus crustaceus TaxID=5088 RepID=UPI003742B152